MSGKKIIKEYVVQPGTETLVPRSDSRWGSFQNTYAVWNSDRSIVESITIRRKIELQQGYYYVVGTVDNGGSVTVNGTTVILYRFDTGINRTNLGTSTRVYHPGGLMDIVINANNGGDVAGVAVTISREVSSVLTIRQGSEFQTVTSIGDVAWSTRTPGTGAIGRYVFTADYPAIITAHVWGAGGAGGAGYDQPSNWYGGSTTYAAPGGRGSPGLYNTTTFTVEAGDEVEVFVGSGGKPSTVFRGAPYDGGNTPGGVGGASRTLVGGQATQSYNGGRGGQGGRGRSGYYGVGGYTPQYNGGGTGGGGGGGASGVLVNSNPVIVAGGGGGGGGSGMTPDQFANGTQGTGDSNADITKNAMNTQITVHSSNYNIDGGNWDRYYFTLGTRRIASTGRGHNVAVVNPTTLALESYRRFDTWANPWTSGLEGYLNSVPAGKILILLSADACAFSAAERAVLQTKFGSTRTESWGKRRRGHAFIGIEGGSFDPVEGISDSTYVDISKIIGISIGSDKRGENGRDVPASDVGGGGGGGGGGYPGGQGGMSRASGDSLGFHYGYTPWGGTGFFGECGGNYPVYPATTGAGTQYYNSRYGQGGAGGIGATVSYGMGAHPGRGGVYNYSTTTDPGPGNPGLDGRVVLEIEPLGLSSVKVGGEWKQIPEVFVKVSGVWKAVNSVFVKVNNEWKTMGAGGVDSTATENPNDYGTNNRNYS